ncbi:sorbitol dehydrogenase, partial [bacterium]|nr:sorbitol dehydrogenase [bacterium]
MSEKGKLVRLIGKNQVEVFEEELPEVKDDGILMEVGLGGICGTDIHTIENA